MKNYLLSLPYMYPVCSISIDHARLFVIADIIARYKRLDHNVYFPIAAHYSGVTADNIYEQFKQNDITIMNLYRSYYGMSDSELSIINSATDLLDFFTEQMLNNFKDLGISCDYDHFYKTNSSKYQIFVRVLFEKYAEKHMLTINNNLELAINFNDTEWRYKTFEFLKDIRFIQKFHSKNIMGAFNTITNNFGFLRNYGIGTLYNESQIIDPMFDGDFFMLYDLLSKISCPDNYTDNDFKLLVEELFNAVQGKECRHNDIIDQILEWLPCDIFICEEHLKTWVVKKTFSEVLLMEEQYRTKEYFITGLGKINNKRMSSSRGNAILLKDLLEKYGRIKTRMIILMCGGHPSKNYNYDENVVRIVEEILLKYIKYMRRVIPSHGMNNISKAEILKEEEVIIKKNIEEGYYGQAISLIMQVIPSRNKKIANDSIKVDMIYFCKQYLEMLLPGITDTIFEGDGYERV